MKHPLDRFHFGATPELLEPEIRKKCNARALREKIAQLQHELGEARREGEARQDKIDALMLEFCPSEMTPEQIETWATSQSRVVIAKEKPE